MANRRRRASPAISIAPPPDRCRLEGPSRILDPRIHAYRRDIADVALCGRLFAPHYVRPEPHALVAPSAMLRAGPNDDAAATSQLVKGEAFDLLDCTAGWAWGRCGHDDYVGYLPAAALGPPAPATHRVTAPSAPVFARADIKSPVVASWPIGARFAAEPASGFLACAEGHVSPRHAAPLGSAAPDPAAVAERLIGLPYLWGGRGGGGIDCSGLVQVALGMAGIALPRDSDLQQHGPGRPLGDAEPLARGDMVFFPGHVGLMLDATRMIHANAHWMAVTIEPLADVVARLAPDHARPVLARRRLEPGA